MKRLLFPAFVGIWMCFAFIPAVAQQEFKNRITKEFDMQSGTVAIYNRNGTVKVEGYSGRKVLVEVEEIISAKNEKDLEQAKKEVQINFEQRSDSLKAYMISPYDSRPNTILSNSELPYSYSINYIVRVPASLSLDIGTINGETIEVSNVSGTLNLRNVRGSISINNAKGDTDARTVRGSLTATFSTVPKTVSFRTISGEIKIKCPESMSADVRVKTIRGDFYTDFAKSEPLPIVLIKAVNEKSGEKTYKTDVGVRIGNGGKEFRLETINGDIYVQKL